MSIQVDLDDVGEQVEACRSYAYLLTVTDDGRPHAVSLRPEWQGDDLVVRPGPRTTGNTERAPEVSLLWPVSGRDGLALFVNGRAEVRMADGSTSVVVKPTSAVLHKTPEGAGDEPGCIPVAGR